MLAVACALASLAAAATPSYATFGHEHGAALIRRMSRSVDAHALVPVRIALEHPSAFLLVGCDDDEVQCAFACVPQGAHLHRVEGMWLRDATRAAELVPPAREWHARAFRTVALLPGKLPSSDRRAFGP